MKHTGFLVAASFIFIGLTGLSFAQDQSMQYYQAGNTLYSQKDYDKAITYYQYATQLNPNQWQAYQGLGNCYYAKGDKATAVTNYQKSLAINPNNPQLSQFVQTIQPQAAPPPSASTAAASSSTSSPGPSATSPGTGANPNLPRQGKIVFEVGDSDWIGSWNDLTNVYGGAVTSASNPFGVELNLGAAYVLSPNFQLGARAQFLLKTPETASFGSYLTEEWSESLLGGAVEGEGVFPISDGINFIGAAEVGFYTLVGSTFTASYTGYSSQTANLSGSGPGGMLSAGIELLMDSNKSWALDIGALYQFISISPVTGTVSGGGGSGTPQTLKNADGSNASLDFSGPGLSLGVRFF
jgi:hypothetical protein